jgi:hypothetical protein
MMPLAVSSLPKPRSNAASGVPARLSLRSRSAVVPGVASRTTGLNALSIRHLSVATPQLEVEGKSRVASFSSDPSRESHVFQ